MIYVAITSCQRNKNKLDYYRNFCSENAEYLDFLRIKFIYFMGGEPDPSVEDVVFLDVPDTYQDLPKKVYASIKYIYENEPDIENIVKMDDDVEVFPKSMQLIREISWVAYWGHTIGHIFRDDIVFNSEMEDIHDSIYEKLEPGLPKVTLKRCIHALGLVYGLNLTCVKHIILHKKEMFQGYQEDAIVGWILNQYNIFPVDMRRFAEQLFILQD